MEKHIAFLEWNNGRLLEEFEGIVVVYVVANRVESALIFLAKKNAAAGNDHLNVPLSWSIKSVGGVKVLNKARFVVTVANEYKLSMVLDILDCLLRNAVVESQVLFNQAAMRVVDGG